MSLLYMLYTDSYKIIQSQQYVYGILEIVHTTIQDWNPGSSDHNLIIIIIFIMLSLCDTCCKTIMLHILST